MSYKLVYMHIKPVRTFTDILNLQATLFCQYWKYSFHWGYKNLHLFRHP